MPEENLQKPLVEYPCRWGYKVIGPDEEKMRMAVKECMAESLRANTGERGFELGRSRTSKGGQYVSLSLNLTVMDEAERDGLFAALSGRPEILMVI